MTATETIDLDAEMDAATERMLKRLRKELGPDWSKSDGSLEMFREYVPHPVIYVDPDEFWESMGY